MTHTSTEQPEALLKMAHYNDDHLTREEIDVLRDAALEIRLLRARVQELEASQARVPLSDEWIKELMGLVSRYGNLNYQECDADYREHQTKSERYAQDQRDTFSAIESKLRTIGITQEKHHGE